MKIIAITDPEFLPEENKAIETLLEAGAFRVHIRKPGKDTAGTENLLRSIRQPYRERISIHDHFGLADMYGIGGIHLNARNPEAPEYFHGTVSRSCHSSGEVELYRNDCGYMFLSPVFDSISKKGYTSGFSPSALEKMKKDGLIDARIFALGGVCPANIPTLAGYGFSGAAILGFLWEQYKTDRNIRALAKRLENCLDSTI